MKVLLHFDAAPALVERTRRRCGPGIALEICPEADEARFLALLPGTEVLWHVLKPVTAAHLAMAPRLRLVQKLGVGLNTIALEAARERGIAVSNTPGANSRAVAEMTLLLILATLRRLPELASLCHGPSSWTVPAALQERLGELGGRSVGLLGFGAVPRLLAPWLAAMGADIAYWSAHAHPEAPFRFMALDELLARSDIVSLHLPLTAATEGLIDRRRLAAMRPGAILINTARGGLVDEAALLEALRAGHLAAAGLDVFGAEPVRPEDPLLALSNVVTTPHAAWITTETLERCLTMAIDNTGRLSRGEALRNRAV